MPPRQTRQRSPEQGSDAGDDSLASAGPPTQCDIFGTTFSLHRVSPLFLGADGLSTERLGLLGLRLREALVGDVVRGVEVGSDGASEATAMGNAGALDAVTIEWAGLDAVFGTQQRAIQITLRYENALCSALLLPIPDRGNASAADDGQEGTQEGAQEGAQFLRLPLLLLRMPNPLKAVIAAFLADTFDCRVAPVRLQSQDLVRSWETWARGTRLPSMGPLAKDAVLTLGVQIPEATKVLSTAESGNGDEAASDDAQGLKTIDIIVADQDLSRFLKTGQKLATGKKEASQPFTTALASYVNHHLALDMSNPALSVVRIACGGFVLGESRIKIFNVSSSGAGDYALKHQEATRHILRDLARRAKGAT